MPNIETVAAPHFAVAAVPSSQFLRRLVISIVVTFLDAAGLQFVGSPLYTISSNSLLIRAALLILLLGMSASLARMWFLTFRIRNQQ